MKKLMGHEPNTKYIVLAAVAFQLFMAFMVSDASWVTVIALAYCLGGTINHSMSLAIHEISHNLAFGHARPIANRILGFLANLPLGIPVSISFRKYHLEHHRYQGDTEKDVDIPTDFEGKFFVNTATKILWVILQPLFYSIRPFFVRPKALQPLEIVNIILQISVDALIVYFWGTKSLVYMIAGTLLATGMHPMAGHFISEHYMFKEGYETYSYYGPLNYLTFNVGYHNEHHDFPSIPGSRLPMVRKIAPEYYDNLPCHTSWVKVIWDFVFDPAIGPYARVKRRPIPVNPSQSIDQPDDQDPASDSNGLQSNGNHVNGIHVNGNQPSKTEKAE
ncbi:sphingolipid delta(4)-desaturase DES1-like isoform X2 [Mya arenaria]|nr:sphingolipid delta(4)-desaturase DES1-like isoform X2 [Mya arenaria]